MMGFKPRATWSGSLRREILQWQQREGRGGQGRGTLGPVGGCHLVERWQHPNWSSGSVDREKWVEF